MELSWELIKNVIPVQFYKSKLKRDYFLKICEQMNATGNIVGYERLVNGFGINNQKIVVNRPRQTNENTITVEFIEKVNQLLPSQPWKPGTHKQIAQKLSCKESEIYQAVSILVKSGRRYRQKNGILYNEKGEIVEIDAERVDEATLKLKE